MKGALFANAIHKIREKGSEGRPAGSGLEGRLVPKGSGSKKTIVLREAREERPSILTRIKKKKRGESEEEDEDEERPSIRKRIIAKAKGPIRRRGHPKSEEEAEPERWTHDKFEEEAPVTKYEPYAVFVRHIPDGITGEDLKSLSKQSDAIVSVKVSLSSFPLHRRLSATLQT
eukprot:TRINITY_DN1022_c0_g1_i4.p1 TRINITY_DN1022_c0_g1~~TRINITY_DN1022_c0_g1_i4.p1  ORF type:complete len:173 (-),score=44.23 TRINITY_DN1022_c0_g1_i4:336-854(-)